MYVRCHKVVSTELERTWVTGERNISIINHGPGGKRNIGVHSQK